MIQAAWTWGERFVQSPKMTGPLRDFLIMTRRLMPDGRTSCLICAVTAAPLMGDRARRRTLHAPLADLLDNMQARGCECLTNAFGHVFGLLRV